VEEERKRGKWRKRGRGGRGGQREERRKGSRGEREEELTIRFEWLFESLGCWGLGGFVGDRLEFSGFLWMVVGRAGSETVFLGDGGGRVWIGFWGSESSEVVFLGVEVAESLSFTSETVWCGVN
jgi:hypothetical protein